MDLPVGIRTLQRTDRWVGGPLCAILTILRRIFESAGRPGPRQVRAHSLRQVRGARLNRSRLSRNSACDRNGWT